MGFQNTLNIIAFSCCSIHCWLNGHESKQDTVCGKLPSQKQLVVAFYIKISNLNKFNWEDK